MLSLWGYLVPNGTTAHTLLLGKDCSMCFKTRGYRTLSRTLSDEPYVGALNLESGDDVRVNIGSARETIISCSAADPSLARST